MRHRGRRCVTPWMLATCALLSPTAAGAQPSDSPAPSPPQTSPEPDAQRVPDDGTPIGEPSTAGNAATGGGNETASATGEATTGGGDSPQATPLPTTGAGLGYREPAAAAELDEGPHPRSLATRMERLHGMMEAGLGWVMLPGAEVCVQHRDDSACRRGDSSLSLEAWQIFRLPPAWALGGGVMLGLTPTTDAPARQLPDVERDHTRGYLTVEFAGRYYPYVGENFEAWVGMVSGLVVVSDTFSTLSAPGEEKPLIGPAGVVIRSEGGSIAAAGGVAYEFSRGWSFGGGLRLGSWFLPRHPGKSPLGDEASLVGRNNVIAVAIHIDYRVPL